METIFYFSNSVGSTLFFEALESCAKKDQKVIHAHSLFSAMKDLKEQNSEENKIIIGDDLFFNTTGNPVKSLAEYISIYETLNSISKEKGLNVKWCFFIDIGYYTCSSEIFNEYCKENGIVLFHSGMYDIEQFIDFINS